jgi:hypothetical protein
VTRGATGGTGGQTRGGRPNGGQTRDEGQENGTRGKCVDSVWTTARQRRNLARSAHYNRTRHEARGTRQRREEGEMCFVKKAEEDIRLPVSPPCIIRVA